MENEQVRPVGQAGYPISLVASLDTVPVKCCVPLLESKMETTLPFGTGFDTHTHTLEKVAPWSVISGCFAVCISPLGEYLALDLIQQKEVQSPLT